MIRKVINNVIFAHFTNPDHLFNPDQLERIQQRVDEITKMKSPDVDELKLHLADIQRSFPKGRGKGWKKV